MNPYQGKYIIDKIRSLSDDSIHERELRRKGQEVTIPWVEINKSLLFFYDEERYVRTSLVKEVKDYDDYLRVYTMNTLYQFKKVGI